MGARPRSFSVAWRSLARPMDAGCLTFGRPIQYRTERAGTPKTLHRRGRHVAGVLKGNAMSKVKKVKAEVVEMFESAREFHPWIVQVLGKNRRAILEFHNEDAARFNIKTCGYAGDVRRIVHVSDKHEPDAKLRKLLDSIGVCEQWSKTEWSTVLLICEQIRELMGGSDGQ